MVHSSDPRDISEANWDDRFLGRLTKFPESTRTISDDFIFSVKILSIMSNRYYNASKSGMAGLLMCAVKLHRGSLAQFKHIVISHKLSAEYP